jgi:hypothetical protein
MPVSGDSLNQLALNCCVQDKSLIHSVGSAMPLASCRITGYPDRWRRLSDEVPQKSGGLNGSTQHSAQAHIH